MSTKIVAVAAAVVVAGAAELLIGARRAQAQAPERPGTALELIAQNRDTAIYHFKHEGRDCYVATTVGGSGISLQCAK